MVFFITCEVMKIIAIIGYYFLEGKNVFWMGVFEGFTLIFLM